MQRPFIAALLLLNACGSSGGSDPTASDSSVDGTDGTESAASTDGQTTGPTAGEEGSNTQPGTTSDATTEGESESESGDESSDETGEPPLPEGICNDDGECGFPETCSTCPDECGSCDVADYPSQQAKYVDQACESAGDGLTDSCAASPGGPGRFNDLQVALDSLVGGDTLYVHPGEYFRPGEPFVVAGDGTQEAPIIVTSAISDDPPTIHSWDPGDPGNNGGSHEAIVGGGSYVVIDGVRVNGLAQLSGEHNRVQNIECTHGWEECDGNWSCIRLEYCNDCNVHHNWVHDIEDTTTLCTEYDPREAGFKEFDAQRAIWEFNTVENTARWGYDLHRSSTDPIARYNVFRNVPTTAIRMNRSGNMQAYGNVVIGAGECINYIAEDPGDGFANIIDHNTCLFAGTGIAFNSFTPTTVTHNVTGQLAPGATEQVNIVVPPPEDSEPHAIDRNAYDSNSWWSTVLYEIYAETLGGWQEITDYDDNSIAAPGGACTFVDAPSDASDAEFDLTIAEGECATLREDGGPIGACAITACVGHDCAGCGF
jgi:hypothetical protein